MPTSTPSLATQVRNGSDLTPTDMAGLKAALETPEGLAKYQEIMRQVDGTSDMRERDGLLWYSYIFWRDPWYRPKANKYIASTDRWCPHTHFDENPGIEGEIRAHATSTYDPDFQDHRRVARLEIREVAAVRPSIGPLDSSPSIECPTEEGTSADILRLMIDAAAQAGILPELFLTFAHWKIEVTSYIRLTRSEAVVWNRLEDTYASLPEEKHGNTKAVALAYGLSNFLPARVMKKIRKAVHDATDLGEREFAALLGSRMSAA